MFRGEVKDRNALKDTEQVILPVNEPFSGFPDAAGSTATAEGRNVSLLIVSILKTSLSSCKSPASSGSDFEEGSSPPAVIARVFAYLVNVDPISRTMILSLAASGERTGRWMNCAVFGR